MELKSRRIYHPFGINLALDKMRKMEYDNIAIQPVPCFMEEKTFLKLTGTD